MRRFLRQLVVVSAVVFLVPLAHAWGQADSKLEPAPSGFASRRDGVDRGKVETIEYDSKSVGDTRKMTVYLPPGYSKDTKYPVFYLLHGAGDNEGGWTRTGAANLILDNLLSDKKIVPMIVVMRNRLSPGAKAGHGPCGHDHEPRRCRQERHRVAGRVPHRRPGPLQGARHRQSGPETARRRPQSSDAGPRCARWPPARARRLRQRF